MSTVVTNTSRDPSGGFKNCRIEMAAIGVVVAIATLARVRLTTNGRSPGQVIEKVLAFLAVQSLRVVRALTASVNHVRS